MERIRESGRTPCPCRCPCEGLREDNSKRGVGGKKYRSEQNAHIVAVSLVNNDGLARVSRLDCRLLVVVMVVVRVSVRRVLRRREEDKVASVSESSNETRLRSRRKRAHPSLLDRLLSLLHLLDSRLRL